MRRLFVGIPASGELRRSVLEWHGEFHFLPVRRTPQENLHITLVPPFYESDYRKIAEKLKIAAGAARGFVFRFGQVVYGPDPKVPRLIWAEGETPEELAALRRAIFTGLGLRPDRRPFALHMTIARFPPENFEDFPIKDLRDKVSWLEQVKKFALFESVLAPDGTHYEILDELVLSQ